MDLTTTISLIDEQVGKPYPRTGYHLLDLESSDDFFDEADGEAARAAWARLDAERVQLIDALTDRWGAPERVVLLDRGTRPTSALARELVSLVLEVQAWHRDGRVVSVGLGQGDKELPVQLMLGVGDLTTSRYPHPH